TNGFAHHRLEDALVILADLGYQSVALTLDYHALNPYDDHLAGQLEAVHDILKQRDLRAVVETGARFLLDPPHKHQPTLKSAAEDQPTKRLDFLRRAVDIARILQADAVSFWSATPTDAAPPAILMDRLVESCRRLCEYVTGHPVRLAFEPE